MRQRHALWIALTALLALTLAACNDSTAPLQPTATGTPPPLTPAGDYAFIRNGDIWVRQGLGTAHQATHFRLNYGNGAWGDLTWSPDHTWLAFALRAPKVAPGLDAPNPLQATGTLYVLRVATGQTARLLPQTDAFTVPLVGRHVAWLDDQTLLFSSAGAVDRINVSGPDTFAPIVGPSHVWEIAVRGATLWYSTFAAITPTGGGITELHRFDLATQADERAATLGPAQLLPQICDLICPPDESTPVVPFAWDVSADGASFAFQTSQTLLLPMPTPTPKAKSTPTPMPSPTPIPGAVSYYRVLVDGSAPPQPIFVNADKPSGRARLAFAPDGAHIALALDVTGVAPFGPYAQSNSAASAQALAWQIDDTPMELSDLSWTSDSSGFTLTALPLIGGNVSTSAATFYLTNGQGITEQNAAQLVWGS